MNWSESQTETTNDNRSNDRTTTDDDDERRRRGTTTRRHDDINGRVKCCNKAKDKSLINKVKCDYVV